MKIDAVMIVQVVLFFLVLAVLWRIFRHWTATWAKAKEHLFTGHGFVVALIWIIFLSWGGGVFTLAKVYLKF